MFWLFGARRLQELGVGQVDLAYTHSIGHAIYDFDALVGDNGPMAALERARKDGLTRFVGITGFPLKIFKYVLDRAPLDTILSYCHYALNDTSLEDLVPYLKSKNVFLDDVWMAYLYE